MLWNIIGKGRIADLDDRPSDQVTGVFLETLDRSLSSNGKGSDSVILSPVSRYALYPYEALWTTSTSGRSRGGC